MTKRIFKALLLIVVCSSVFSSCTTDLTSKNLAAQALIACLPTCTSYDLRNEKMEKLEEDSYGRVLIAKEIDPSWQIYPEDTVAISILQKYDKNNVYFYDDLFYIFLKNASINEIDISSPEISDFKELNDWNKSLDDSKMSSRKTSVSMDLVVNRKRYDENRETTQKINKEIRYFLQSVYAHTDENDYYVSFCDFDEESKELYFAMREIRENEYDCYFVLRNVHGNFEVMKINDIYSYQQDLASFKKSNGWEY